MTDWKYLINYCYYPSKFYDPSYNLSDSSDINNRLGLNSEAYLFLLFLLYTIKYLLVFFFLWIQCGARLKIKCKQVAWERISTREVMAINIDLEALETSELSHCRNNEETKLLERICWYFAQLYSYPASSGAIKRIFSSYGLVWSLIRYRLEAQKLVRIHRFYRT